MILASKFDRIKESDTFKIFRRVRELIEEGREIIPMNVGEPDFMAPQYVKDAAINAILSKKIGYTEVAGIVQLKKAICTKFARDNNLNYDLTEIMASHGGKQAIYNAIIATIDEGDEVILPVPYWVSYPDIVLLAGGQPVYVYGDKNYKLTAHALESAISNRTKWVIINSPNNPSGIVYSAEELASFAEVLRRYPHVCILSDDIYENIIYNAEFHNILNIAPDLKNRTCIVNGVSKSYGMTGWRIGYAAGPSNLIKAMTVIQSQSTSSLSIISQEAALAALNGDQSFIQINKMAYRKRRDLILKFLEEMGNIEFCYPEGAFYFFVNFRDFIKKLAGEGVKDDYDLVSYILEHAGVASVAGTPFGMPGYVRFSYAIADELIERAFNKIITLLKKFA